MTEARNPGNGPVFRHFRELARLPPEERHGALMERLEHTWNLAAARSYTNKHGDPIPMPDTAVMLKVIQAVAVLHQMTGPASEAEAAALARMTDADLVREATRRLPPSQVAELADALIAQREQERSKAAIVTSGETTHDQKQRSSKRRSGAGRREVPGPNETETTGPSAPDVDPEWS